MAYTVAQMINEYNSEDAIMLSNLIIGKFGILTTAKYYLANKKLAHTYTRYATLPTAGIRSLHDGVAASTVQGSTKTANLSLLNANGSWDQAFVGGDFDSHWNTQSPLYFQAVAKLAQKSFIYGKNATFGNADYATLGLHQTATANSMNKNIQNAAAGTSIFAVRYAPVQNIDGAALVVDPLTNGGLFYFNDN